MPDPTPLFSAADDATATLSPCGAYRYDLTRTWTVDIEDIRRVLFVMLNPSTADALAPDNTMTKCVNFAKSWGFDGLAIVNLFALRSTDPGALKRAKDPVGPDNDDHIRRWLGLADQVVVAWGAHPFAGRRIDAVLALIRESGKTPHYLRLTKDGHPWHPLYLPGDLRPIPMEATR